MRSASRGWDKWFLLVMVMVLPCQPRFAVAQAVPAAEPPAATGDEGEITPVDQVDVRPRASDEEISQRLQQILESTGWFSEIAVRVENGVAFLRGRAAEPEYREWAEQTALRTTDVVAVVNRLEVTPRPIWDLTPAAESLEELGRDTIRFLPMLAVGLFVVLLFFFLARLVRGHVGNVTSRRMQSVLLGQVVANLVAVLVLIVGVYIALRIAGLTRLAVTLLGGTGLLGLAIGFAFRDIAENYLSSILISLNRPFRINDFIEVEGHRGFVLRVTTRGTTLMTLAGNHVQIPNSTVYKGMITNFTANRKVRETFMVGIGFDDSISRAQEVIFQTLSDHAAVLADPPPSVLVHRLGSATVDLECILWVDIQAHSLLKVKSAAIRQVKRALMEAGISMPDEAREVVFPQQVPVRMLPADQAGGFPAASKPADMVEPRSVASDPPAEPASSEAEGQLDSEASELSRQASASELPDGQTNLLTEENAPPPDRQGS